MNTLHFADLDEDSFQGILVVSCSNQFSSDDWLKRIINNARNIPDVEFKPVLTNGIDLLEFDKSSCLDSIECQRSILDNKYYNTQIYLMPLKDTVCFPERFYEFLHGAVIYFDTKNDDSLKLVDKWTQYLDNMENCSIKILACETAADTDPLRRVEIQNYCIVNGFELVELNPFSETESDNGEEDCKESNSFERLYQAIQAYVWPNLNYKQKGNAVESLLSQSINEDIIKKTNSLKLKDKNNKSESKTSTSNEKYSEKAADNFDDLFSRFMQMKEQASKLDNTSRKQYAERIAIDFWNSISDDKDEVSGFSSEEESEPNHVYI